MDRNKTEHDQDKQVKNKVTTEFRIAKDRWLQNSCNEDYCLMQIATNKPYNNVECLQPTLRTSNILKEKEGKLRNLQNDEKNRKLYGKVICVRKRS